MPTALLPGQISQNRETGPAIAWAIVGLALVLAVGAWRFRPQPRPEPVTPPTPSAQVIVNPPGPPAMRPSAPSNTRDSTADLLLHVGHAQQQLIAAAEQLAAARRVLAALSPELNRNYLQFQRRRADSAGTACDAAQRAVEHALDELNVITPSEKE